MPQAIVVAAIPAVAALIGGGVAAHAQGKASKAQKKAIDEARAYEEAQQAKYDTNKQARWDAYVKQYGLDKALQRNGGYPPGINPGGAPASSIPGVPAGNVPWVPGKGYVGAAGAAPAGAPGAAPANALPGAGGAPQVSGGSGRPKARPSTVADLINGMAPQGGNPWVQAIGNAAQGSLGAIMNQQPTTPKPGPFVGPPAPMVIGDTATVPMAPNGAMPGSLGQMSGWNGWNQYLGKA